MVKYNKNIILEKSKRSRWTWVLPNSSESGIARNHLGILLGFCVSSESPGSAVSVGTKTTLRVATAQTSQAILTYLLYYFCGDYLWNVRFLGSLFPGGGTKDDAFLSLINLNKIMTYTKILEPRT